MNALYLFGALGWAVVLYAVGTAARRWWSRRSAERAQAHAAAYAQGQAQGPTPDYILAFNALSGALQELRSSNENLAAMAKVFESLSFIAAVDPIFLLAMEAREKSTIGLLESINNSLVKMNAGQRQILRDTLGAPLDDEEETLEQVKQLRDEHPSISIEDALKRIRAGKVYSTGR